MGFREGGVSTKNPKLEVAGQPKQLEGFIVDIVTDDAIRFLRERQQEAFLLMLHYREPHTAYMPVRDEDWAKVKDIDPKVADYPDLDVARAKKNMREYLASVAALDRNIGRLLAVVDELKLREDTIIVFTSDHGYNIGQHGIWHKGNGHYILNANKNTPNGDKSIQRPNVFDTSLRTPTAIRWPRRIKAGTEIQQTINNLDWFPTLLALAGVELPKGLLIRGRDFSPLLAGKSIKWDNDLYVEWSQHHYTTAHLRMYRTPEWKLVRDFLNAGKDELYNLKADPGESKNLIGDPATNTIRQQLEAKLLAKMRANNDSVLKP